MSEIRATLGRTADGQVTTGETANSILHVPVTVLTGMILGMIALAEVGFVVLSWFIYKVRGKRMCVVCRACVNAFGAHRNSAGRHTKASACDRLGDSTQLKSPTSSSLRGEHYHSSNTQTISDLYNDDPILRVLFRWLWHSSRCTSCDHGGGASTLTTIRTSS